MKSEAEKCMYGIKSLFISYASFKLLNSVTLWNKCLVIINKILAI